MDLEMAQEIIEQEALPLLLANPKLRFNLNGGFLLTEIFRNNKSCIVTRLPTPSSNLFEFVFKIDHPTYGIGFYSIINRKPSMLEQYSDTLIDY